MSFSLEQLLLRASLTFSMSKKPARPFLCSVIAPGQRFAQVKWQIPWLASHLRQGGSPGITNMGGDIVPPWDSGVLWLPMATFSRLGREEGAGLGRDRSPQVLVVLEGCPSP